MLKKKSFIQAAVALSLLGSASCTRKTPAEQKAENRRDAEKSVETKRDDIAEIRTEAAAKNADIDADAAKKSRDAYVKAAKDRLAGVKDRLNALDGRLNAQTDTVKTAAATDLIKYKGERASVDTKLKELSDSDKLANWGQLRSDIDRQLSALEGNVSALDRTMSAH